MRLTQRRNRRLSTPSWVQRGWLVRWLRRTFALPNKSPYIRSIHSSLTPQRVHTMRLHHTTLCLARQGFERSVQSVGCWLSSCHATLRQCTVLLTVSQHFLISLLHRRTLVYYLDSTCSTDPSHSSHHTSLLSTCHCSLVTHRALCGAPPASLTGLCHCPPSATPSHPS